MKKIIKACLLTLYIILLSVINKVYSQDFYAFWHLSSSHNMSDIGYQTWSGGGVPSITDSTYSCYVILERSDDALCNIWIDYNSDDYVYFSVPECSPDDFKNGAEYSLAQGITLEFGIHRANNITAPTNTDICYAKSINLQGIEFPTGSESWYGEHEKLEVKVLDSEMNSIGTAKIFDQTEAFDFTFHDLLGDAYDTYLNQSLSLEVRYVNSIHEYQSESNVFNNFRIRGGVDVSTISDTKSSPTCHNQNSGSYTIDSFKYENGSSYSGEKMKYVLKSISNNTTDNKYNETSLPVTFENLYPDTYRMIAYYQNSCIDSTEDFTIDNTDPITIDVDTLREPRCHNDANGEIQIEAFGGKSNNFSYTFSNSRPESYSLSESYYVDASWLSEKYDVEATPNSRIYVNLLNQDNDKKGNVKIVSPQGSTVLEETNNSESTYNYEVGNEGGEYTIIINGDTYPESFPYYYLVEIKVFSPVYTDMSPNPYSIGSLKGKSYKVFVMDENNCGGQKNFGLTNPDILTGSIISTTNPTCNGDDNGEIEISSNGGSGERRIILLPNESEISDPELSALTAGPFKFQIEDDSLCRTDTLSTTLYDPDIPSISVDTTKSPTCSSAQDGEIKVYTSDSDITIDTIIHSFETNTPEVFPKNNLLISGDSLFLGNIQPGVHSIHSITSDGCPSDTVTTNVNTKYDDISIQFDSTNFNGYGINCSFSDSLQSGVKAIVSGGSRDFHYTWYKGSIHGDSIYYTNVDSISFLEPDTEYIIYASDNENNECYAYDTITLTAPSPITVDHNTSNYNGTPIPCHGGTGSISFVLEGGIGSEFWYKNQDSTEYTNMGTDNFTINGVYTGSNTFYFHDSLGCPGDTLTISLPEPDILDTAEVIKHTYARNRHITCHDAANGQISVLPTGGTAPYRIFFDILEDTAYVSSNDTGDFQDLQAKTIYNLVIRDTNNCETAQIPVELTNTPDSLYIEEIIAHQKPSGDHISCTGFEDGKISIISTGGTYPHYISIYDSANTSSIHDTIKTVNNATDTVTFYNLAAGTYTLGVADTNGCMSYRQVTLTEPESPVTASVVSDSDYAGYDIDCFGNKGSATANGNGGSLSYSYNWPQLSNDSSSVSGLEAETTYEVVVTDTNSCSDTASIILSQPDRLQLIKIDSLQPTCSYEDDGVAIFTASGGAFNAMNPVYTFNLDRGNTELYSQKLDTASFEVSHGNYTISVIDSNNCSASDTIQIINRDTLRIQVDTFAAPHCHGGNDGWISVSGVNGELINGTDYYFTLSGGSLVSSGTHPDSTFYNLTAQTYQLTIEDDFGCTDTLYHELEAPSKMSLTVSDTIPNLCYNDGIAELEVQAQGGYAPYNMAYKHINDSAGYQEFPSGQLRLDSLNWNRINTNEVINYIFFLRDSNYQPDQPACQIVDTFTLPVVKRIDYIIEQEAISCHGESDGMLNVSQMGGGRGNTSDWTFEWKNINWGNVYTTQEISGLGAGTYHLTITDTAGCSREDAGIELPEPQKLTLTELSKFPVSIAGGSDGSINYLISGGDLSGGYHYSIDNGPFINRNEPQGSSAFLNLSAESHTIEIYDINGCHAYDTFEIHNVPPGLKIVDTLPAGYGLSNGAIIVEASGGDGNYTYHWRDSTNTALPDTGAQLTGIPGGHYSVYATDGNLFYTDTLHVFVPETDDIAIALSDRSQATCRLADNGFATVVVSGGAGNYSFVWQNANGEVVSVTDSLNQVPAGEYYLTVTDEDGLTQNTEITIPSLPELSISNVITTRPSCSGDENGRIEVAVTGGSGSYSINWQNGNTGPVSADVMAGMHGVTISDNNHNACTLTDTIALTEPEALRITTITTESPTCHNDPNGRAEVSASGGTPAYSYEWPGLGLSSAQAMNLSPGDYTVRVSDVRGCIDSAEATISNPDAIEITAISETQPSCQGDQNGKLSLQVANGTSPYLVQWTENNQTGYEAIQLEAGNHPVKIIDAYGCSIRDTLHLSEPDALDITAFDITNPLCNRAYDGSITASVSGGTVPYRYTWSTGQLGQTASAVTGGSYILTVTDKNLCETTREVQVAQPEPIVISVADQASPSCFGYTDGFIEVSATGGTGNLQYAWSNGQTDKKATGLAANSHGIVVTDDNNCEAESTLSLTQPDPVTLSYEVTSAIPCYDDCNGEITLNTTGGTLPHRVQWPDNSTDFIKSDLCSGTYEVITTDANGCERTSDVVISQPDPLVITHEAITPQTCYRSCDALIDITVEGGTNAYAIDWSNSDSGLSATGLCAGEQEVTITDTNGCVLQQTYTVPETEKVEITGIPEYIELCDGQTTELDAGIWAQYQWSNPTGTLSDQRQFVVSEGGHYNLYVVSAKGCSDTLAFEVEYRDDLLEADFLMKSDAIVGDTVEIIDVSWPQPQEIAWSLSGEDSITVLEEHEDRQMLIFNQSGEYFVTLYAKADGCEDTEQKSIFIFLNSAEKEQGKMVFEDQDEIKSVMAYPNPTSGLFNLEVTLSNESDVVVSVSNMNGSVVDTENGYNAEEFTFEFNLGNQLSGVYLINIQSANSSKTIKLIVY